MKRTLLNKNHSKHSQTSSNRWNWYPESEYCDRWPLFMSPRSLQVMEGHQQFFGNNFWKRSARAMKTPEMCSGRRSGSTDMHNDLFQVRSWLWPEVKFSTSTFKVKLYIIRRGWTWVTRCWQKKCCVSTESKVIELPLAFWVAGGTPSLLISERHLAFSIG